MAFFIRFILSVLFFNSFLFSATAYQNSQQNFYIINPEDTRNITGNTLIIGNTVECVTAKQANYANNSSQYYDYGDCTDDLTKNDNNYLIQYIDNDTNDTTYNSSSATISFPSTYKQIEWAGLFWQGHINNYSTQYYYKSGRDWIRAYSNDLTNNDIEDTNANTIQLKVGDGEYKAIQANRLDYVTRSKNINRRREYGNTYSAYADVTDDINSTVASGTQITIANIATTRGLDSNLGNFGAWTLVIVYKEDSTNDSSKLRNNSVYYGYKSVSSGNPNTITITDFLLPRSGDVESQMAVFAGEGEYTYSPDTMSLDGTSLGETTCTTSGDDASCSTNVFDAKISPSITRSPSLTNNNGIDIDVFDTSSIMTTKRDNDPTATNYSSTISLSSNWDLYLPSMVSFTTELYKPRICYYIDTITDDNNNTVFEDAAFTTSVEDGKNYHFNVWFSNMQSSTDDSFIETAELVQVYVGLTDLAYQSSSTYMKNLDDSDFTFKTDSTGDDIFDFSTDSNQSTYRIGIGATSSQGGTISPASGFSDDTKKAFVKFQGTINISDANATSIDLLDFFDFKASFKTDSITITSDNAQEITQCRDLDTATSIYETSLGAFNVVNTLSSITTEDPEDTTDVRNALLTQIVDQNFSVDVVNLNADDLVTLESTENSVILDVVDASGITSDQDTCDAATVLYNDDSTMGVTFNSSSRETLTTAIDIADQNATFRVKYIDWDGLFNLTGETCANSSNMSSNLLGVPQCYNGATATSTSNKLFDLFDAAGFDVSQCTQGANRACYSNMYPNSVDIIEPEKYRHDYGCLACLLDVAASYTCSRDKFAIRPATYSINIDTNDTQLIGGKTYQLDINATTNSANTNATGYTQTIDNSSDKNATEELELPATCTTLTSNITLFTNNISFTDGQAQTSYSYDNVGDINITVNDSKWTKYDQSSISGKTFSDCIEGSSSNTPDSSGKVGCLISGMQQFQFFPKEFSNTLSIENFNNDSFTYISSDENMSADLIFQATAVLNDGTSTATNYTAGCFSRDINTTFTLMNNPTEWLDNNSTAINRITYFDDENTTSLISSTGGVGILTSSEGNFTSGITNNVQARFNFTRSDSLPDEPFFIDRDDFNISISDEDNITGSSYTGPTNSTTKFYYGRSHAPDQRFIGNTGTAKISYETYCKDCNKTNLGISTYAESSDAINWYINSDHTTTDHGVFNKNALSSSDGTTITSTTLNSADLQAPIVGGVSQVPHKDKILLNSDSWLIYSPTDFLVEFYKAGGDWAGEGQLGETVDINVSTRQNRRLDW